MKKPYKTLVPSLIILLFTMPTMLQVVNADVTQVYSQTLPSNTVLFDDMEITNTTASPRCTVTNSSLACDNWYVWDGYPNKLSASFQCGTPVAKPGLTMINETQGPWIFDGQGALQVRCATNTVTQDARKNFYSTSDVIGYAGWFAINCNIASPGAGIGAAPAFSLEYWDSNQHRREGKIQLNINGNNPAFSNWKYFHDSAVISTIAMGTNQYPVYPGWDCLGHYTTGGRNFHAWMPFKIVINRATNQYVSITTPEGVWTCQGSKGLTSGCTVNDDGVDTNSIPSPVASTVWALEVQIDTGSIAVPQTPNYWAVALDNVLVTDESTPPNLVQFALFNSAYYLAIFVGGMVTVLIGMNALKTPEERNPQMKKVLVFATVMGLCITVIFIFGLLSKG